MATFPTLRRAAEYVRMSTDLQCYSIANQQARIREYAKDHQLEIVCSYTDSGRSGLRLHRLEALQQLLADVINKEALFEVILVYDVSRWGRFQDLDEAAHYEFLCRQAGKRVLYCAEPFDNDGSPMASIVKGLKRVMAGEYSRELSDKVFCGQARLASLGYHVGARAAYGLRRMIIDKSGASRGLLEFGQRKALQSDRVVLVPGPPEEISVIQQIFCWFINEGCNYQQIADRLNGQNISAPPGLPIWNRYQIKRILSNEKYLGTMLYNRTSSRLATPRVHNPSSAWVKTPRAFTPVITQDAFDQARERRAENPRKHRKPDLIAHLHRVLNQHGYLSGSLLRRIKSGPAPETYQKHFGSIDAAFKAAGYDRMQDPRQASRRNAATRQQLNHWVPWVLQALKEIGHATKRVSLSSLMVDEKYRVTVTVPAKAGTRQVAQIWLAKQADVVVVVGLPTRIGVKDFLVFPPAVYPHRTIYLSSPAQIERVKPWQCSQSDIARRIREVILMRITADRH